MTSLASVANPQYFGLTGRIVRPAYNLAVVSQLPAARQSAALDASRRQFDESQALAKKTAAVQEAQGKRASLISGATSLATIGAMTRDAWLPYVKEALGATPPAAASLAQIGGSSVPAAAPALSEIAGADLATGTLSTSATPAATPVLSEIAGADLATGALSTTTAGQSAPAPGFMSYAAPAVAGYAAPQLLDAIHEDSTRNLGRNLTLGLTKDKGTARDIGSTAVGAGTGAAIGTWALPGIGTALGAFLGGAGGFFSSLSKKSGCIIVTACTSPDSPEVDIARAYRDKFLSPDELRGYYMLADRVEPMMALDDRYRHAVKECLVDPLIEYGRYALGRAETVSDRSARIAAEFISYCNALGKTAESYVRSNGEIY